MCVHVCVYVCVCVCVCVCVSVCVCVYAVYVTLLAVLFFATGDALFYVILLFVLSLAISF